MKNYGIVSGLTENPKTPLALSLSLMQRLNSRDLQMLWVDRNVAEPLRIAARKRVAANASGITNSSGDEAAHLCCARRERV